uniref:Cytochrome P450 n=1 Tax=Oryza barthii TaxID=65489 RepID=A0A0D3HBI1_9ORYZ
MASFLPWLPWLLAALLSVYLLDLLAHSRRLLPAGPRPLPLIGSLHLLGDQPHRSLAGLAKMYGPLMSLRLGAVTTVVVSSPDVAREFLQRHDAAFASRSVPDATDDHATNSVAWLPNSPRWRALRRIMAAELFAPHRLDALRRLRREKVQELVDHVARLAEREGGAAADLFAAGSDTSSSIVEWAIAELMRNPLCMIRACDELSQVIGSGTNIEESDIGQLPYLQAVVKETFRLHPPVPLLLPRQAETTTNIAGYTIPKGARVFVNVWAIGRHKDTWSQPEKIMPERFFERNIDFRGVHFELIPFGKGRRICPGMPLANRMVHLVLGSLLNQFKWNLPVDIERNGIDMSEKFGLTLVKAIPLCALVTPISVESGDH